MNQMNTHCELTTSRARMLIVASPFIVILASLSSSISATGEPKQANTSKPIATTAVAKACDSDNYDYTDITWPVVYSEKHQPDLAPLAERLGKLTHQRTVRADPPSGCLFRIHVMARPGPGQAAYILQIQKNGALLRGTDLHQIALAIDQLEKHIRCECDHVRAPIGLLTNYPVVGQTHFPDSERNTSQASTTQPKDGGYGSSGLWYLAGYPLRHEAELKSHVDRLAKVLGGKASAMDGNPLCCFWVDLRPWNCAEEQHGFVVRIEEGGSELLATNLAQLEKAIDGIRAVSRTEGSVVSLPLGLLTNYPIIRQAK